MGCKVAERPGNVASARSLRRSNARLAGLIDLLSRAKDEPSYNWTHQRVPSRILERADWRRIRFHCVSNSRFASRNRGPSLIRAVMLLPMPRSSNAVGSPAATKSLRAGP